MLNKRLTNLLRLLTQEDFKKADELAAEMGLSTKTLRKLVDELRETLQPYEVQIVSERGRGFMLQVDDLDKFRSLFAEQPSALPNTSEGRVNYIIEQFLRSSGHIKIEKMCDALYVSRKTLAADIKEAEHFFESCGLHLERRPHYGMKLVGSEMAFRLCQTRYLERKHAGAPGYGALADKELRPIVDCVLECLQGEEYRISDMGLHSLIQHLATSVRRIRQGQYITMQDGDRSLIRKSNYVLAEKCVKMLEERLDIRFPPEEIEYFAIHFAGKESHQNLVISQEIQTAIQEMLQEIYDVFLVDLRGDLDLIVLLGTHLVPLVIRMRYGLRLENPMLSDILEKYALAYLMASQACAVLERRYCTILDANEIGYIAMALELSLERHKSPPEKKRVLFVRASGATTAQLVAYRIQELFRDSIDKVVICDRTSISRQNFQELDVIFTTVPIEEKTPVPIIEISTLLTEKDVSGISRFLWEDQEHGILYYYPEELFFPELDAEDKEDAIRQICERIAAIRPLPKGFYELVLQREKLARTCMGNGVAMPHPCKVVTDDTFVSVGILKKPIRWDEEHMVRAVFLVSVAKGKNKKIRNFYSSTANLLLSRRGMDLLVKEKTYQTLQNLLMEMERSSNNG